MNSSSDKIHIQVNNIFMEKKTSVNMWKYIKIIGFYNKTKSSISPGSVSYRYGHITLPCVKQPSVFPRASSLSTAYACQFPASPSVVPKIHTTYTLTSLCLLPGNCEAIEVVNRLVTLTKTECAKFRIRV